MNQSIASTAAFLILSACALAQAGGAESRPAGEATKVTFNFDSEKAGQRPAGWTVAETKGAGTPATWTVEAVKDDPKRKQAAKVQTANKEAVFNLLLSEAAYKADLTIKVSVLSGTGEDDQGGGLFWRAKDADNYYVTRWNPLEKNLRLYKVVAGKRSILKSAEIVADPKTWHDITVVHEGSKIAVSFDGKVVAEAEDSDLKDAGKIGLWTKADACTWFDDLEVTTRK
jgi:hypothetical protein